MEFSEILLPGRNTDGMANNAVGNFSFTENVSGQTVHNCQKFRAFIGLPVASRVDFPAQKVKLVIQISPMPV